MVQMPGLNTPQFEWARNKFAWAMRPVPPVFEPEVAARAIFKVAQKPVRELWVGSSTIQSIVGQFLFPGLLDRLMVKKAWEGQMTDDLNAPDRRDYLDQPVNDLHKIHGRFRYAWQGGTGRPRGGGDYADPPDNSREKIISAARYGGSRTSGNRSRQE